MKLAPPRGSLAGRPGFIDEDAGLLRAYLPYLLKVCHPGDDDAWGIGPITLSDLDPATGEDASCPDRVAAGRWCRDVDPFLPCRACEIDRIRHLADSGWPLVERDPHPILVDVGCGTYVPDHLILDGNHRVMAAAIRGEACIDVAVQGDLDRAFDLLVLGDLSAWDR